MNKLQHYINANIPALPVTIRARWRSIVLVVGAAIFGTLKLPFEGGKSMDIFDDGLDIKKESNQCQNSNWFEHYFSIFFSFDVITDILNGIMFIQYVLKKKKKKWNERLRKESMRVLLLL